MAIILVDYENVAEHYGLLGVQYLNKSDKLFLFYSEVCGKIRNHDFELIRKTHCKFEIIKLLHPGKNALDFYIATKLGMEYQKGERQIVIVSKDKGFSAVLDYISTHPTTIDRRIIRSSNIENGLLKLTDPGNEYRRQMIAKDIGMCDVATAQAYIQARADLRDEIEHVLRGTRFESESEKIINFIDADKRPSKKAIYSNSLHEYGLQEGLELYRIIKEVV